MRFIKSTGSTNADLLEAARKGAPDGLVEVADHQTAGRGRQGRTWIDGGLHQAAMFSALVYLDRSNPDLGLVPLATGMAVCDGLESLGVHGVALKWPNDVLAVDRATEAKLAGILVESQLAGDRMAVVIGVGINLLSPPTGEVPNPAVGVAELTEEPPGRDETVTAVVGQLDVQLAALASGRFDLDRYRSRCVTIGRKVRLDTPAGPVSGMVVEIADDGTIGIKPERPTSNGSKPADEAVVYWSAGDAHHQPNRS